MHNSNCNSNIHNYSGDPLHAFQLISFITRRMQGIVGASGKFILFLSSMFFFISIKNIHAHMGTIAIRI